MTLIFLSLVPGPCNESTPCIPGNLFADPLSCSKYYRCNEKGTGFDHKQCPPLNDFDENHLDCLPSSEATCLLSCGPPLQPVSEISTDDLMLDDEVDTKSDNLPANKTNTGGFSNTTAENGFSDDEDWVTTGTESPEGSGVEFGTDSGNVFRGDGVKVKAEKEVLTSEANKPLTSADDKVSSTNENEVEASEDETTAATTTTTMTATTTIATTTTTTEPPLVVDPDHTTPVVPPYDVVTDAVEDMTTTVNASNPGNVAQLLHF